MLALQFVWLRELDRTTLVSHRAALRSMLETAGGEIEHFYRSTGERLLNVPAALFKPGDLGGISDYWKTRSRTGVRRLFVVDFTFEPTGNFYIYVPEREALVSSQASDESLAIVLATLPWHRWARSPAARETLMLQADESDPNHRIILRPVIGETTVIGIVGFIVDPNYLREQLLPKTIDTTLATFFAEETRRDLIVGARDREGTTVFGPAPEAVAGAAEAPIEAHLSFIFTDWILSARSVGATQQRFSEGRFGSNMALGFLSACVLIAGIALAFYGAGKSMRLSRMKSDFVSNVSHELRTPLASIRVFAEFLRSGKVKSPEKVVEYGEYIETESRRLSRLIDNILDFSRIESRQKEYRRKPTDIVELVRTVVRAFDVRLEQANMKLQLDLPESTLPAVEVDEDAIGQALHNLLDNAVKYSESGREIGVRVACENDYLTISVRDQGIGIAKSDQEKVFERFHRVSTGLVHDVKGSGLGLSIVDHIAKAHGGRVTVESELGRGSTFSLCLAIHDRCEDEGRNHDSAVDRRG